MEKTKIIFSNKISKKIIKKGIKSKNKFIKKFGDDTAVKYHLKVSDNKSLGNLIGIKNLEISDKPLTELPPKPILISNIRMGFGHYRMSMAIASCAHHMGYTPLWFDLLSYNETTGAKVIKSQSDMYSLGSRLSQKSKLFNRFVWEPMNYETFKRLDYNAVDQKNSELMTPIFNDLNKDIPLVATHVWPAQAAVHAGMKNVINAIPDNWAMALHYSEGAVHTVQTPNVYWYYKTLEGMDKKRSLKMMPDDSLKMTGHYIDHELVVNIENDCAKRIERVKQNKAKRFLMTIGGAGAQKDIFAAIIKSLIPHVNKNKAVIFVNIGDYKNIYNELCEAVPGLKEIAKCHFDNFEDTKKFAEDALDGDVSGIHFFCHDNIYEAVYSTNLLMRAADVLVTKPSELAFYPVPKLFIKRVGKHEMWGAIHSSHIGDGTYECDTIEKTKQMLKLFMDNDNTIIDMCNNIIRNKNDGIYNGGYEVVKLATKNYKF